MPQFKIKHQAYSLINTFIVHSSILYCFMFPDAISAQIVPDATLPSNSIITQQNNINTINEGTRAGNNLFHSFENFSLPTGQTAYFNNALDIQNIFSRVTGRSTSNIDGIIRANGTANLFLINPNGIVFGPNAALNIGGSFIGTTANRLKFFDGREFSAIPAETTPLLTVSTPIDLILDNNPSEIRVQGSGHNLVIPSLYSPVLGAGASSNGLRVLPGKTLALVGGNIILEGGILTAPGGRIELGSGNTGTVNISPTTFGWALGYQNLQNFQNIELSKKALLDTSGSGNSTIQLIGKQISLREGSVALIQNQGSQAGSGINIQASNLLELSGTSPDGAIPSGIEVETLGGATGDVVVSTKFLTFENGAAINNKTFTETSSGSIFLNASQSIEVKGFSFVNPTVSSVASGVGSYTFGGGTSGNIIINTGRFMALDGGTITSATFSTGIGGDLIINANNSIELSGFNPFFSSPSQIAVGTYSSGNSGNLKINSPEITLKNGGLIASYTFSNGNAGNITIDAPNFINIITLNNTNSLPYNFPSGISSYAVVPPPLIRQAFGLPFTVSGNSSNIKIKTARLFLSNSSISVTNLGFGLAGDIDISANKVFLINNSSINAVTAFGNGGNIFLQANQAFLNEKSVISSTASNIQEALRLLNIVTDIPDNLFQNSFGNGGNIVVNTNNLVALDNSRITANAFKGQGGNISISTKGFFFSNDSFVSASSQLGIDGKVELEALYEQLDPAQVEPVQIQADPKIASSCQGNSGSGSPISKFVIIGTGSAPRTLDTQFSNNNGWRPNSATADNDLESPNQGIQPIVEAQSVLISKSGEIILSASPSRTVGTTEASADNSCFTALVSQ